MEGDSERIVDKGRTYEDESIANMENSTENEEKFQNLVMKKILDIQSQITGIHKDITLLVVPKFLDVSVQTNDLIELAIELWRMEHKINKILPTLSEDQQDNLNNSMQKLKRYLGKNDIEIVDHTDQKYDEGQNLDILAVEKDPDIPESIIKETKEPTILYKGQIVHIGKVIVVSKE